MFAVVAISGKQYKVHPGDILFVEGHIGEVGKTIAAVGEVLLLVDTAKVKVGKPALKNVQCSVKILGHDKGEKLTVRRFKAKSRYRRRTGFRPLRTKLEVVSIGSPAEKTPSK